MMLQGEATAALVTYWPVLAVAGSGLAAWGTLRARVERNETELEKKASKESVDIIGKNLERVEGKIDRLLERGAA